LPIKLKNYITKRKLQIVGVFAILLVGSFYLHYTWIKFKSNQSNEILQISRSIVATLPNLKLEAFDVKINDTVKPEYKKLKKTLHSIIKANPKARFAYIYIKKNNKLYFIADSEPKESIDYSPPGQEYTEAYKAYYSPFINGKEYLIGPATDRWGTWMSVLVPIKNEKTGETLAVYAMDFNSKKWNTVLLYDVSESIILILLLISSIILLLKLKSKNKTLFDDIKSRKLIEEKLTESEHHLRTIIESEPECIKILDILFRL